MQEGDQAPDFELPDQDGQPLRLSSLRGRTHGLPFTLLADTDHAVAEAYGVWVESRCTDGSTGARTTFVIGPDGEIQRVLRKVKPAEHDELVLGALA